MTDIPTLIHAITTIEDQLHDHFKATNAHVDSALSGEPRLRLEFRGFETIDAALEKIDDVVTELQDNPLVSEIDGGFNTDGGYDHETDAVDDRPAAWVNIDFDLEGYDSTDTQLEWTVPEDETLHVEVGEEASGA